MVVRRLLLMICGSVVALASLAQTEAEVRSTFQYYFASRAPVHLELTFNQAKYTPGDTIWFNAWLMHDDLTPTKGIQLVHVHLIDHRGNSQLTGVISTRDGVGHSQLILPATLEPAFYQVVAFTAWQRNFGRSAFFKKDIPIVKTKSIALDQSEPVRQLRMMAELSQDGTGVDITISAPPVAGQKPMLVLTRHESVLHVAPVEINAQGIGHLFVPATDLKSGIIHLSVLLNRQAILQQQMVYKAPNVQSLQLKIESATVKRDEPGQMSFSIRDDEGKPLKGEFAVTVLNDTWWDEQQERSLLASDLFAGQSLRVTDGLEYNWSNILARKVPIIQYPPEVVIQKNGVAFIGATGQPVPDLTRIGVFLQYDRSHYETFTTSKGRISLTFPTLIEQDEFFYTAEYRGRLLKDVKVKWDEDTIRFLPAPSTRTLESEDAYGIFMSNARMIDRAFSVAVNRPVQAEDRRLDFESEVANGDYELRLDDYILFPTMEEFMREVAQSVLVRRRKKGVSIKMALPEQMRVPNGPPVFLIDGVATRDVDTFLALKTEATASVKVIRSADKLVPLGVFGRNGIIIAESKVKKKDVAPVDSLALVRGVSRTMNFPTASGSADAPRFRSARYWNPSVRTDASGKGRVEWGGSQDDSGYLVHIVGMTEDRRSVSLIQRLPVRQP